MGVWIVVNGPGFRTNSIRSSMEWGKPPMPDPRFKAFMAEGDEAPVGMTDIEHRIIVGFSQASLPMLMRKPFAYRHFSRKTDHAGVRYSIVCNGYTPYVASLYMCRGMPIAREISNRSHGQDFERPH